MFSDLYIQSVRANWQQLEGKHAYYCDLPAIANLRTLDFEKPATFFCGENGTGKSTLLEAIAIRYGFNPEGGSKNFSFSSRDTHANLGDILTISRGVSRCRNGFFLRAESFYNVASYIDDLAADVYTEYEEYGGRSLHRQSHGESFFSLASSRFRGQGLYILDEPEAALSPQRQLAFMATMHELIAAKSQFIIATHSPFLLGYPGGDILSFDGPAIAPIAYEDTETYRLTKMYIEDRQNIFKRLFDETCP